ncbi:MAG TPA: LysR family transcriptional regulator [Mycobacteriales bacterium]
MNLRNVDLNLLVALDALLAERSVSRAGQRIGLSQPATSGALARLRKLFGDPLLVRVGRDLALTEGAENLVVPVREILTRIEQTIQQRPGFVPATDSRTFSISASDYATLVLLVPFLRALAVEAPGITINILPRSSDARRLLHTDQADLVIEPRELLGETEFPSRHLFGDRWLCAVDAGNPQVPGSRITWEQYLRLPHLIYSIGADQQLNLADQHLEALGVRRRIEITVESFLLVPFLLQGTPLASLVLERVARRLTIATNIRTLDPPLELPDINETMYWHPRHTTDPAHHWLRERLHTAATALG